MKAAVIANPTCLFLLTNAVGYVSVATCTFISTTTNYPLLIISSQPVSGNTIKVE
jgi:hypothetical protein